MDIHQLTLEGERELVARMRDEDTRITVGQFLHLGAGVQSSALLEMVVEGALRRIRDDVICIARASHCARSTSRCALIVA